MHSVVVGSNPVMELAFQLWLGRPLSGMEKRMSTNTLVVLHLRVLGAVSLSYKGLRDTYEELEGLGKEDQDSLVESVLGRTREGCRALYFRPGGLG